MIDDTTLKQEYADFFAEVEAFKNKKKLPKEVGPYRAPALFKPRTAQEQGIQVTHKKGFRSPSSAISKQRRDNFALLLELVGEFSELEKLTGIAEHRLQAIFDYLEGVGDALAKHMERHLELPVCWFDQKHTDADIPDTVIAKVRQIDQEKVEKNLPSVDKLQRLSDISAQTHNSSNVSNKTNMVDYDESKITKVPEGLGIKDLMKTQKHESHTKGINTMSEVLDDLQTKDNKMGRPRLDAGLEEVVEVRRANLAMLCAARGAQKRLAQLVQMHEPDLSNLLKPNGTRRLHSEISRKIEHALGLAPTWLDWPRKFDSIPQNILDHLGQPKTRPMDTIDRLPVEIATQFEGAESEVLIREPLEDQPMTAQQTREKVVSGLRGDAKPAKQSAKPQIAQAPEVKKEVSTPVKQLVEAPAPAAVPAVALASGSAVKPQAVASGNVSPLAQVFINMVMDKAQKGELADKDIHSMMSNLF